jgi:hypothetical protein
MRRTGSGVVLFFFGGRHASDENSGSQQVWRVLVLAETAVFGELRRKLEALFGSIISELTTIRPERRAATCSGLNE